MGISTAFIHSCMHTLTFHLNLHRTNLLSTCRVSGSVLWSVDLMVNAGHFSMLYIVQWSMRDSQLAIIQIINSKNAFYYYCNCIIIMVSTLVITVLGKNATFPWKGSFHNSKEFCAVFPVPTAALACSFAWILKGREHYQGMYKRAPT